MRKKKIADKDELLTFLTGIMRSEEAGDKERFTACIQLAKYLGLEEKNSAAQELPKVIIYDGIKPDRLS